MFGRYTDILLDAWCATSASNWTSVRFFKRENKNDFKWRQVNKVERKPSIVGKSEEEAILDSGDPRMSHFGKTKSDGRARIARFSVSNNPETWKLMFRISTSEASIWVIWCLAGKSEDLRSLEIEGFRTFLVHVVGRVVLCLVWVLGDKRFGWVLLWQGVGLNKGFWPILYSIEDVKEWTKGICLTILYGEILHKLYSLVSTLHQAYYHNNSLQLIPNRNHGSPRTLHINVIVNSVIIYHSALFEASSPCEWPSVKSPCCMVGEFWSSHWS